MTGMTRRRKLTAREKQMRDRYTLQRCFGRGRHAVFLQIYPYSFGLTMCGGSKAHADLQQNILAISWAELIDRNTPR